jgi:phosphatidylglycerophosphate synthase
VPARFRDSLLAAAVAATPEARAAVAWLEPGTPAPPGALLLLPATTLTQPVTLAAVLAAPPSACLDGSAEDGAPVVAARGAMVAALWPQLVAGRALGDAVDRSLKASDVAVVPGAGWAVHALGTAARREAETRIYADLVGPADTWLDVALHRRLARPLSRVAVATGIRPNFITIVSLLIGLLAAACFWRATPAWALAGLLAYIAAVVVDHVDGAVARLTFAESRFGAGLDVVADTVVHAALMLVLGVTAGGLGAVFGAIGAAGAVASAALTQTWLASTAGGVASVLDALSSRDGFYAMLLLFIVGLTVAPAALPALMLVVALGTHAFWIGGLIVRLRGR